MNSSASLIQVTLSLLLMVGLILALAWLMKRFQAPFLKSQKHLRLIDTLSLGVKEKIILVEVDGKQLVLGVTQQQITPLHTIENPVTEKSGIIESSEKDSPLEIHGKSDFSKKLMEILKGKVTP